MAQRMLARTGRPLVTAYLPNLSAAVQHFRTFSSYNSRNPPDDPTIPVNMQSNDYTDTELIWPDKNLGPLANKDSRFPLPGSVGVRSKTTTSTTANTTTKIVTNIRAVEPLLDTTSPTRAVPSERHISVLSEFLNNAQQDVQETVITNEPSALDKLEFAVHACPQLLHTDFLDLFPERRGFQEVMTVITISQKTEHDMSGWSEQVEEEREHLLEHFIQGATQICESLQEAGYWSDFIDPSSGRPYLGAYTNATLFETDERYRHLGFDIKDMGCCKMTSQYDTVCCQLDDVSIEYLETLDELMTSRRHLDTLMKSGFYLLAKSRYTMSGHTSAVSQIQYSDDVTANNYVIMDDDGNVSLQNDDVIDTENSELRRRKVEKEDHGNQGVDEVTDKMGKISVKTKVNPLHWFGILVPQTLRQSQTDFTKTLPHLMDLANSQNKLQKLRGQYKSLMDEKRSLSAIE